MSVCRCSLPPQNDILGAQLSPDKSLLAIRVSDKEVKVLSTATGEVLTARSCRPPTRMISVHWLSSELTLLFITNAGIELYSLIRGRLKHIKTAPYSIVYHWVLLSESLLLLVDNKSMFQIFQLSSKALVKVCKFELDCKNTSLSPPVNGQSFHRDQISLLNVYGRMVVCFINEAKAQLHLLSLLPSSDEMEQTHVFDLYQPGKYELSCIDDVLVVHQSVHRVSLLFDIRTDSKSAITDPLAIGGVLSDERRVNFYSPDEAFQVPALDPSFEPYRKWTFLSPRYVWESIGDQQQGHFWTLSLNNEAIALSWPVSKRARLVDMLMKRSTPDAKLIVLQLILQLICTEPSQLSLLSRMFSMIQRIAYDQTNRLPSSSSQSSLQSSSFSSPRQTAVQSSSSPHHKNSTSSSPRFTRQRSETASSFASSTSTSSSSPPIWDLDADPALECERMDLDDSSAPSTSSLSVEQTLSGYMLVSQLDMFTFVLLPARRHLLPRQVIPAVIEYLRSIYRHRQRVEDYINDLLVSLLVADCQFYALHQFLQYHLLLDSLPIANRLIDIAPQYAPAYQLGLDMLHRLGANNRLVQVLLQRHQVLPALKLVTHKSPLFDREGLQVRDWLRAAMAHGDELVFFTTFRWMEARNLAIRNTNVFYASDKCDEYVLHYTALFGAQHRLNPPASHKEVLATDADKAAVVHPHSRLSVEELRKAYAAEEGEDWDEWSESDWLDNVDEINAIGAAQAAVVAAQEEQAAQARKALQEERLKGQSPVHLRAEQASEAAMAAEEGEEVEGEGEEEEEEEVEDEEAEDLDPHAGDTELEDDGEEEEEEEEEEEVEVDVEDVEVDEAEVEDEEAVRAADGADVEAVAPAAAPDELSPHPESLPEEHETEEAEEEEEATPRQFDDGEDEETEVEEEEEEEEDEEEDVVDEAVEEKHSAVSNGVSAASFASSSSLLSRGASKGHGLHVNGSRANGQGRAAPPSVGAASSSANGESRRR